MKRTTILAVLGLTLAGAAGAATFADVDTNGDGVITLGELQAMYPEVATENFVAADVNADGSLDAEELAAAGEAGLIPMTDG